MALRAVRFNPMVTERKIKYVLSMDIFPVVIRRDLSLIRLARECGIEKVNKKIKSKRFPLQHELPSAEYRLVHFLNDELSGKRITKLLLSLGYEMATIRETLSFFVGLSRRRRNDFLAHADLVALGSQWKKKGMRTNRVPFVNFSRGLVLSLETTFQAGDMFLVRKLPEEIRLLPMDNGEQLNEE